MFKLSIGVISILVFLFIPGQLLGSSQPSADSEVVVTTAPLADKADALPQLAPEVKRVLDETFCSTAICGQGSWQQWVIISPEYPWQAAELVMVSEIFTAVIESLDHQGLDGRTLLSGYRFRRQHGEYIVGHEGRLAVVNHATQEITLADSAFKRLRGFYIIHELGHVVDLRTGRQLSTKFHSLAGSDQITQMTAEGYWLNLAAQQDLEEATADAFALWIMGTFAAGYRPVFAFTPLTADYEGISGAMAMSLDELGTP